MTSHASFDQITMSGRRFVAWIVGGKPFDDPQSLTLFPIIGFTQLRASVGFGVEHEVLVTIEEGAIGGFGSHVMHLLAEAGALETGIRVRSMVFPDAFLDQDSPTRMYETALMTAADIKAKVVAALGSGSDRIAAKA
jgi:hypothetical protein